MPLDVQRHPRTSFANWSDIFSPIDRERTKFRTFARELNTDDPGWKDVVMETFCNVQAGLYELFFDGFLRVLCSGTCCIRRFQEVPLTAALQQQARPPARLRDVPPRHPDAR